MTLRQTAQGMRQSLEAAMTLGKETGWNLRTLPRGLQMLLSFDNDGSRWRLALRREGVWPSQEELEICAEAFEVPPSAICRNFKCSEKHSVTHRKVVWFVIEMTWREQRPSTALPSTPHLPAGSRSAQDAQGRDAQGQDAHARDARARIGRLIATGAPVEGPDSTLVPSKLSPGA